MRQEEPPVDMAWSATADLNFKRTQEAATDERQMNAGVKTVFRRRSFLRVLAAGGWAAAASTAPLGGHAAADTLSYDQRRKPLYRETEEVKTFYRVNRYPTERRR